MYDANDRTLRMYSLRVFSLKPRTLMSSIMRSRSALPGRCEGSEVIGGSSLELKVAGPSMLGIGCPDRHALPLTHAPPSRKIYRPRRASSRESGFVLCPKAAGRTIRRDWLGLGGNRNIQRACAYSMTSSAR